MSRETLRLYIDEPDWKENAWCERVGGNTYRALNTCIGDTSMKLPADIDMKTMPEGHPGPDENGRRISIHWGHLLECLPNNDGSVSPICVVGWDGTPVVDEHID